MHEKPNYLKEAAALPAHRAALVAAAVAALAAIWRGQAWVLVLLLAAEALYLLVFPQLPGFRRACDRRAEEERARSRALELEQIAARLSPNAKSRLDGLERTRAKILDSMRTLSESRALEQQWAPRLDSLCGAALRILVAVDSNRADDRDARFLASEVAELEAEVAALPEGAARKAKAQRLELARKRAAGLGGVRDQREAAVAQLETIEDLLQDLLTQGLAGRDADAFAGRIDELSAQIAAAGESVGALDRHAETESQLAALEQAR